VSVRRAFTTLILTFASAYCCSQVVSGDCLVVRDAAAGSERRVFLSSIRAPRLGRREEKSEPYAVEAKEFLRNRLIGECASVGLINRNETMS